MLGIIRSLCNLSTLLLAELRYRCAKLVPKKELRPSRLQPTLQEPTYTLQVDIWTCTPKLVVINGLYIHLTQGSSNAHTTTTPKMILTQVGKLALRHSQHHMQVQHYMMIMQHEASVNDFAEATWNPDPNSEVLPTLHYHDAHRVSSLPTNNPFPTSTVLTSPPQVTCCFLQGNSLKPLLSIDPKLNQY